MFLFWVITTFWHSIVLDLVSATVSTIIGTLTALALHRYDFRDKDLLDGLLFVLMMVRTVLIPVIFPAMMAGWLRAFTLSLDDVVVYTFVINPSSEILSLRIYSMLRVGFKPKVNATGTILLVASLILMVISQLLLRRR